MKKIPVIDGLRGLAVLMVVYQHTLADRFTTLFGTGVVVRYGLLGVTLFFILSGFVLYRPYLLGEREFNNWGDVIRFYKHRFWRLYPLFFIHVIIVSALVYNTSVDSLKSGALSLTLLSQFTSSNFYPAINAVIWTLVVEIMFSLVFPALIVMIRRYGYLLTSTMLFSVALAIRLVGTNFGSAHQNPVKDFFLARIDDFFIGMLICFAFYKRQEVIRLFRSWIILIPAAILFALGTWIWEFDINNQVNLYAAFVNNIIQLSFVLLILVALNQNWVATIFQNQILRACGIMCFSIYLWHNTLVGSTLKTGRPIDFVVYLLFTATISLISFVYFEKGNLRAALKTN